MKRRPWVKDDPTRETPEQRLSSQEEVPAADISIDALIDKGLIALSREIQNLLVASRHKLQPAEAKDLRDHLKLLFELQEREKNALDKLSDEELNARANQVLNDSIKQDDPS